MKFMVPAGSLTALYIALLVLAATPFSASAEVLSVRNHQGQSGYQA